VRGDGVKACMFSEKKQNKTNTVSVEKTIRTIYVIGAAIISFVLVAYTKWPEASQVVMELTCTIASKIAK